jgi:FemAB-related protein (PEP-CTERM system-associated)
MSRVSAPSIHEPPAAEPAAQEPRVLAPATQARQASTEPAPDGNGRAAATPDIHLVDGPPDERGWEEYVARHADGTLFHTLSWRDAVRDAFPHQPIYLAARRDGRTVGVLPLFLVRSFFGGRMLVSVPYGVGGGIIADDPTAASALFDAGRRVAGQRNCPIIELRSDQATVPNLPVVGGYVGFQRTLPDRPQDVADWLPRKARAAARNARMRFGLLCRFGDEHLPDLWRLYTRSMRRLGSINYPARFVRSLVARTPGRHWIALITRDDRPVAGVLTLLHRDRVMPYLIGTNNEGRACSAANFVYRCIMERAVEEGFRTFDFGRSRRDNEGSCAFKRFCGFEPRALEYQCWARPGARRANLTPSNGRFRAAQVLWRHLPLWFTRPAGAYLSRHLPG